MAESLAAAEALLAAGARQIFFKYCSTFDSTDAGNIGPVADALLKRLGAGFAIACPAFPANGRSIYQGHLFVGARLLSENGMENHPLTPMKDPDLVRVLGRQTDGGVGLVPFAVVEAGAVAIRREFTRLTDSGRHYAIVDAISDAHLFAIGEACAGHALITGGSGVAMGLPANFRGAGLLPERADAAALPPAEGMCRSPRQMPRRCFSVRGRRLTGRPFAPGRAPYVRAQPREFHPPVPTAAPVGLLTTCLSLPGQRAEAQVSCGFRPQP